jgi:glycosyltransferase involved in cell wall biosynthesis
VKLSLVMPIYNEGRTLKAILATLGTVDMPIPWELVVVDDGSTDGAAYKIDPTWLPGAERVCVVRSDKNRGKGAAVRKGFSLAEGDILGVQDADLEYDPRQIPTLIEAILEGTAEVVFGTREFGTHTAYTYWHVVGNKVLSVAASALFNRYVTDVYTCYKFFTRDRYDQLHLTATGFEIEAELVGGLLRSGARVMEVPITYQARSREEGKKIRARDGVVGLGRMIRIRLRGW